MSCIKNTLLALSVTALFSCYAQAHQGTGKVTFTGEVIDAPCSIKPGDEDLKVNLGEVSTTILNSGSNSLAEDFTIHLQDCILTDGTGTVTNDKVKVTFTSANTYTGQTDLLKNIYEGNMGAASNVGVRILDSGNGVVALGTAVEISFPNTSSYQELNFKARMEAPTKTATIGDVYAEANYVLDYK